MMFEKDKLTNQCARERKEMALLMCEKVQLVSHNYNFMEKECMDGYDSVHTEEVFKDHKKCFPLVFSLTLTYQLSNCRRITI